MTLASTPAAADPSSGLTTADLRRAALAVCSRSTDAAEARQLLEALGLLEPLQETAVAS